MKSGEFFQDEDERASVSLALERLREAYSKEQASPATEQRLLNELRRAHEAAGKQPAVRAFGARPGDTWRPALHFGIAALLLVACGLAIWVVFYSDFGEPAQIPGVADVKGAEDGLKTEVAPEIAANETKGASEVRGSDTTRPKTASHSTVAEPGLRDPGAERKSSVRKPRGTAEPAERTGPNATRPSLADTPESPGTPALRRQDTAFIPTMVPVGTDSDYGLQVVRVELPKRTMRSFGLPVEPGQLNRSVKADLIIGPDGLTRAIRFVAY